MLDEKQIPETVFKMASSTFVAEVEASTLAIMAPRLDEGSKFHTSSASGVKRQAARIIENFCKLVTGPRFLGGKKGTPVRSRTPCKLPLKQRVAVARSMMQLSEDPA